ncbi:MAG: NAD(P)-dependent oxidoreductase [Solibacillus sp.]
MLNIREKKVVVVGGGKVAYPKVKGLLAEGACMSIVSPDVTEEMVRLIERGQVSRLARIFEPRDVSDAFLVIAATNSRQVNSYIADCCHPFQLVNIVDDPERSTFHVPAKLRRGDLVLAVSTGGVSPLLAKKIIDDLAEQYPDDYVAYVAFLAEARKQILAQSLAPEQRKILLQQILDGRYYQFREARQEFFAQLSK